MTNGKMYQSEESISLNKNYADVTFHYDGNFSLQTIIHPGFNNVNTLRDDIALVKLTTALSLPMTGNLIAPICMPHISAIRYTGQEAVTSGWGVTSVRIDCCQTHFCSC